MSNVLSAEAEVAPANNNAAAATEANKPANFMDYSPFDINFWLYCGKRKNEGHRTNFNGGHAPINRSPVSWAKGMVPDIAGPMPKTE